MTKGNLQFTDIERVKQRAKELKIDEQDQDPALLAVAVGDIARARGMTQLAKDAGLSRESLYRSSSGERAPSSDRLFMLKAMGLQLSVHPAKAA